MTQLREVIVNNFPFSQLGLIEFDEDRYILNELGDVFDEVTKRNLKQSINTQGYKVISLKCRTSIKRHTIYLHHLVYHYFIDKDFFDNKIEKRNVNKEIDHINQNCLDNKYTNLRAITKLENLYNRGPRGKNKIKYEDKYNNLINELNKIKNDMTKKDKILLEKILSQS